MHLTVSIPQAGARPFSQATGGEFRLMEIGFNPSSGSAAFQPLQRAARIGNTPGFNPSSGSAAFQPLVTSSAYSYKQMVSIPQAGARPFSPLPMSPPTSTGYSFNPSSGSAAFQPRSLL